MRYLPLLIAAALPAAAATASKPAKAPAPPSTANLTAQLLTAAEKWSENPADEAEVSKDLKSDFRVISRDGGGGRKIYGLVAPAKTIPGRLLQFGDAPGAGGKILALKRAYLHAHWLVLEFDAQKVYRDLRKPDPTGNLELAGYVADDSARGFKEAEAFEHALKTYLKEEAPPKLAAAAKKAAGGKPYTLEAARGKDGKVVVAALLADGTAFQIKAPAAPAKK